MNKLIWKGPSQLSVPVNLTLPCLYCGHEVELVHADLSKLQVSQNQNASTDPECLLGNYQFFDANGITFEVWHFLCEDTQAWPLRHGHKSQHSSENPSPPPSHSAGKEITVCFWHDVSAKSVRIWVMCIFHCITGRCCNWVWHFRKMFFICPRRLHSSYNTVDHTCGTNSTSGTNTRAFCTCTIITTVLSTNTPVHVFYSITKSIHEY